jgi:RNA polymerase sporulation-specific sigma factor
MHIRKISNQKNEISLDEPINLDYDGNELLLSDIMGTEEDMILRSMEDDVDLFILRRAVSELPHREKKIIELRFGLNGHTELTQKEVADSLGISQSYISRLEKKIVFRIKKEITKLA